MVFGRMKGDGTCATSIAVAIETDIAMIEGKILKSIPQWVGDFNFSFPSVTVE